MDCRAPLHAVYLSAIVMFATGCLVDPDKPCARHQVELDGRISGCVCAPGTVPNDEGNGCAPCGSNEIAVGESCECKVGYRRQGTSPCRPIPDGSAMSEEDAGSSTAPPSGLGVPCSSPADCAGFEAAYCQMLLMPYICLVPGCAQSGEACFEGTACCSFEKFPPLASTGGLCIPPEACMAPGELVNP
jgi:hypothetical protein